MTVKVRLSRHGRKNKPFYHIVVANSRSPRDGRFIEKLGYYNPMAKESSEKDAEKNTSMTKFHIDDMERIKYWLKVGAQFSEKVARLLVKHLALAEFQKFIPAPVQGEFYGISRKERNKTLLDREEKIKKDLAERKKQAAAAKKAEEAAKAEEEAKKAEVAA